VRAAHAVHAVHAAHAAARATHAMVAALASLDPLDALVSVLPTAPLLSRDGAMGACRVASIRLGPPKYTMRFQISVSSSLCVCIRDVAIPCLHSRYSIGGHSSAGRGT